ncbi:MAG: signal peptide peptidase SppA [Chloroflexi bacterium]|nr:MAG: signal peptide peptidase SppA [Chloroflexota bacterium]
MRFFYAQKHVLQTKNDSRCILSYHCTITMTDSTKTSPKPDFFTDLKRELGDVWKAVTNAWTHSGIALRNSMRRMRDTKVDYILMPIDGTLPERASPPRSFVERQLPLPPPPLSMQVINRRLQAVADAENVKGVVFLFQNLHPGLATLQNLRRSFTRLQEHGKEVIVYTPVLDMTTYYAATAADRIIVPPSAQFEALGLRMETTFLKDAMAQIGIEMDVIQISPYKTALNMFGESDITPQQREQLTWLLDDRFDEMTATMANGRSLSQEALQSLIDQAPLFPQEALKAGLIDDIAYEDELVYLLAAEPEQETEEKLAVEEKTASAETTVLPSEEIEAEEDKRPQAKLLPWPEARGLLLEKARQKQRKFVGVISLEGTIMMGASRRPPIEPPVPIPFVGGETAGELTLRQQLRAAEKMDNMAALIFHVDSGGGSALASDIICREIERVSQKKPVVVYMGNAAASGGYYVSAYAKHIMAQTGTITGSIGVISGRVSTKGLLDKLQLHQVSLQRGARAGLYQDSQPMTADERQVFWDNIVQIYSKFKEVVANGRSLPYDELDEICEGRVWTGRQALDLKLVDSTGDFVDAVRQAAKLGKIETDDEYQISVINVRGGNGRYAQPNPFEKALPPDDSTKTILEIVRLLLGENIAALQGQPLTLMPFDIKF